MTGTEPRAALLIGVADYTGASLDYLPSAAHDARELERALEVHLDSSPNFDVTAHVIDEPGVSWGANDILADVDRLIDDSDHFLFYFSGHGVATKFGLQLATPDRNQYLDSGVYFDTLLHRFNAATAEVTVILDCCFAGLAGDQAFQQASRALQLTYLRDGVTILASSGRNEESEYIEGEPSAFTSQVLATLNSGDATTLDVIDLYDYARKNLLGQTPVLRTFGSRFSPLRARDLASFRNRQL